jgi:integrase
MDGLPARRGRGRRSSFFPVVERRPLSGTWPRVDRAAWDVAIAPAPNPLRQPGPAAHLSPSSQRIREQAYGSYLCWLQVNGHLDPSAASPAERVRPEWVAGWLAETRTRVGPKTALMALVNLALSIEAMVPGGDWKWIRRLPGRPTQVELRLSRRRKPAPDSVRLVVAAFELCDATERQTLSIPRALQYRNALIIALACYHALRLRNLAEIELDTHLRRTPDGVWWLSHRRTKNGEPLTPRLGAGLVPYLETYLRTYRPLLLRGREDHGFLWVNHSGLPLGRGAFKGVFQRMGIRLAGQPLNPHAVRHGLATALIAQDPANLGLAAAALGHVSTASVNQVYDRTDPALSAAVWSGIRKKRGLG